MTHTTNDGPALGLGQVDATLADYEGRGGLDAAALELPAERIVDELKVAGLPGYGGAGFPTGLKWESLLRETGERVLAVNADEGEPGTFKDRYVMERRPHLLLDGALIAMRALGIAEGYIYLREEYATRSAAARRGAGRARRRRGLLTGSDARAGGRRRRLHRRRGDGDAGVDGGPAGDAAPEASVSHAARSPRPPDADQQRRDARSRAGDRAPRRRRGGPRSASNGARGTRLWSVSGCVAAPGCYEAPNGITLRELIDGYAGGVTDEIGAIVPGGAASGILPPDALDAPLTRDGARAVRVRRRLRCGAGLPRRATRRCASSPRRCGSSPRSPARSARRAGSATGRSSTSPSGCRTVRR